MTHGTSPARCEAAAQRFIQGLSESTASDSVGKRAGRVGTSAENTPRRKPVLILIERGSHGCERSNSGSPRWMPNFWIATLWSVLDSEICCVTSSHRIVTTNGTSLLPVVRNDFERKSPAAYGVIVTSMSRRAAETVPLGAVAEAFPAEQRIAAHGAGSPQCDRSHIGCDGGSCSCSAVKVVEA